MLALAGGAALAGALAARGALGDPGTGKGGDEGHGDDDHDDDGGGRGRGRGRGRGGEGDGDAEQPAAAAEPLPPGAAVVQIFDDDGFDPPRITVDPGQPIAFVNRDGDDHTATGSAFDTGIIPAGGGVAEVVLEEPGRYPFACRIHPNMVGEVAVRGADGAVPVATPAATPVPGAVAVRIANFAFDPPRVTVPVGGRVAWTNDDASPHTVTADDGDFDSGILDPNGAFDHRFEAAGTFAYHCDLHPTMLGEVVVGPAAGADAGTPRPPA